MAKVFAIFHCIFTDEVVWTFATNLGLDAAKYPALALQFVRSKAQRLMDNSSVVNSKHDSTAPKRIISSGTDASHIRQFLN